MPAKPRTVCQREAERRRKKLEDMREQIEAGTLTVRRMTARRLMERPTKTRPSSAADAPTCERAKSDQAPFEYG
jgi:hypothetical protein